MLIYIYVFKKCIRRYVPLQSAYTDFRASFRLPYRYNVQGRLLRAPICGVYLPMNVYSIFLCRIAPTRLVTQSYSQGHAALAPYWTFWLTLLLFVAWSESPALVRRKASWSRLLVVWQWMHPMGEKWWKIQWSVANSSLAFKEYWFRKKIHLYLHVYVITLLLIQYFYLTLIIMISYIIFLLKYIYSIPYST